MIRPTLNNIDDPLGTSARNEVIVSAFRMQFIRDMRPVSRSRLLLLLVDGIKFFIIIVSNR